jgi:hypothetical protein
MASDPARQSISAGEATAATGLTAIALKLSHSIMRRHGGQHAQIEIR